MLESGGSVERFITMSKGRLRFCTGPSCGPGHSAESLAELETIARERGYEVAHCDCLGGCPVGPNALSDDGKTENRRQQTLLTGLESRADLEKVLTELEAALDGGARPRTVVGRPPQFRIQKSTGTPA